MFCKRTVELRPGIEVSRVRSENHPPRLVGNSYHLIVNSLEVEVCHDDEPIGQADYAFETVVGARNKVRVTGAVFLFRRGVEGQLGMARRGDV